MRSYMTTCLDTAPYHEISLRKSVNSVAEKRDSFNTGIVRAWSKRWDDKVAQLRGNVTKDLYNIQIGHGADWVWRPKIWQMALPQSSYKNVARRVPIHDGVVFFHDCQNGVLDLAQGDNPDVSGLPLYGLEIQSTDFDGDFLSLAVDFPKDGLRGIDMRYVVQVNLRIDVESEQKIFARINVKHGPNIEQMSGFLSKQDQSIIMEFDLAYVKADPKRIEHIWVDFIFEKPNVNLINLRDMVFSRYIRAML